MKYTNDKIIAHRGFHKGITQTQENSRTAFENAINFHVRAAEFDLFQSADEILMISHNKNIFPTHRINLDITKCNANDIKSITRKLGNEIITFDEYVNEFINDLPAQIEFKTLRATEIFIDKYNNASFLQRVLAFSSMNIESVRILRQKFENTALISSAHLKKTYSVAKTLQINQLHIEKAIFKQSLSRNELDTENFTFRVFTVTKQEAIFYLQNGAENVFMDEPLVSLN